MFHFKRGHAQVPTKYAPENGEKKSMKLELENKNLLFHKREYYNDVVEATKSIYRLHV